METLSQASNLKRHSIFHSEKKSFTCEICAKTFFQTDGLHKHKLTHNTVKTFQCHECEYSCYTASTLTVHNRTNTKEKPYQPYQFVQKHFLKQETLIVTNSITWKTNLTIVLCVTKNSNTQEI